MSAASGGVVPVPIRRDVLDQLQCRRFARGSGVTGDGGARSDASTHPAYRCACVLISSKSWCVRKTEAGRSRRPSGACGSSVFSSPRSSLESQRAPRSRCAYQLSMRRSLKAAHECRRARRQRRKPTAWAASGSAAARTAGIGDEAAGLATVMVYHAALSRNGGYHLWASPRRWHEPEKKRQAFFEAISDPVRFTESSPTARPGAAQQGNCLQPWLRCARLEAGHGDLGAAQDAVLGRSAVAKSAKTRSLLNAQWR